MGFGEKGVKECIVALISECNEVLNEINWKPWKQSNKEIDEGKLLMEMIDTLQFTINLFLVYGFTFSDVEVALEAKLAINYERLEAGY